MRRTVPAPRPPRSGFSKWLLTSFVAALLLACNPAPEAAPAAIERTFEDNSALVTLRLENNRINMAQSLQVRVEIIVDEHEQVEFPESIGASEDFRVAGSETSEPHLLEDGRIAIERRYELEPYSPGEWTIPPFRVEHFDPRQTNTEPQSIETEPIDVQVDTVLTVDPQQADIEDIRDPLTAPLPWEWIVGGALFALLLALLAWKLYRRKKPEVVAEEPPPPAYEIALERLDVLLKSDMLDSGRMKEFYLELTQLLRVYIEGQFYMRAPERTTEEFLEELRQSLAFNPEQRELLRQILQHGDMVKFAELKPSKQEALGAADLCRRFIEETRPRPTPDHEDQADEARTMSTGGDGNAAV